MMVTPAQILKVEGTIGIYTCQNFAARKIQASKGNVLTSTMHNQCVQVTFIQ